MCDNITLSCSLYQALNACYNITVHTTPEALQVDNQEVPARRDRHTQELQEEKASDFKQNVELQICLVRVG